MTFQINEYNFINVSAEQGINTEYFQDIFKLVNKHQSFILDDYLPKSPEELIELIDSLHPWFFIVLKNDEFLGFMYCHGWYGNEKKSHSCFLTAAATRKFYGKDTRKVLALFCNYLFDACGVVKVRAEVMKENKLCIKLLEDVRFKKEGFLKCNTLINGKPQDLLIYGKINPSYLKNINHSKINVGV